jgi:hypothetical protein
MSRLPGIAVKRERATQLLEEMLQRMVAGGAWLDLIEEIDVFGSYARGALEPDDVDVRVDYRPDREASQFWMRALTEGRDPQAPMRLALRGRRRGLQFMFGDRERAERRRGIEFIAIYRCGDTLDEALARVRAIPPDQSAGRAEREAILPAFEGLDRWLPFPIREALVELVELDAIAIEQAGLPDGRTSEPRARRIIDLRWASDTATRRAVDAAVSYLERQDVNPSEIAVGDKSLGKRADAPYVVSWTLARLNHLPQWVRRGEGLWVAVVNPSRSRSRPLEALVVNPVGPRRVPEGRWTLLQRELVRLKGRTRTGLIAGSPHSSLSRRPRQDTCER